MNESTEKPVVKSGTFLYDGLRICRVLILQTDFCPGTGDYEDPPEVQDDKYGTFFEIQYTAPRGGVAAGGGCFGTLAEAMAQVERKVPGVQWDTPTDLCRHQDIHWRGHAQEVKLRTSPASSSDVHTTLRP